MAERGENPILKEAKKRFRIARDAEAAQRRRDTRVLQFQVGEYQWDSDARREQAGNNGTQPPRPMISVPKLRQPLNLVRNQFRAAHFGVNIHPKNEHSNKKGAEIRQDLIRTIEADSGAEEVRFWAYDRAVQCGLGVYRIRNVYDDATGDPFDQKLVYERIYDQSLVYFDPAAQKADKSDGRFAFVLTWVPVDDFKEQFLGAEYDYADANDFEEARTYEPEWVRGDGDTRAVLVVEYFRKKAKGRKYVTFDDDTRGYEDETPKGRTVKEGGQSLETQETVITIYKMTSLEVLDETPWPGRRYIPLVPVLGEELQPFDGERRRQGMVEPAMEACQGYNYAVSKAIEITALEPRAPVVGWEGMFEGHENKWNTVNTHNWNYLEVKPKLLDGTTAPSLPQRLQADTTKLGMSIQLAQQFDQDIQSSTNVFDAALGRFDTRRQSGKAIEFLQQQSDAGTSGYMHNMQQISLPLDARILLDAMPYVYDRPERVMQVIDAEGRPRPIMLNAPYTVDQESGVPMVAQAGAANVQEYMLGPEGDYGVTVTIGKSFQSRQQQGQEQLGQMIQADPAMMLIFGDIWARFLDVPGAPEIADRMLRVIESKSPGLTKNNEQMNPAQVAAQLQAKEGELQQLKQMLSQATQALETEMAKQQGALRKSEIDNQAKQAIAQQNNAMELMVQRLESLTAITLQEMKNNEAARQRQHEVGLRRVDVVMGQGSEEAGRRHEMGMERARAGMAMDEAERGREHDMITSGIEQEYGADQAELDRQATAEEAERTRQAAAVSQSDGSAE